MARPRLRDTGLELPWLLEPGPANAITDVPGVAVGHAAVADPAARTGVTAILPHPGDPFESKCPAAVWALNGSGECTGAHQINEWGVLETPVLLTGTASVGRVFDGVVDWLLARNARLAEGRAWVVPCVAECHDGWLNDPRRYRAGPAEVAAALDAARGGAVAEGAVGAGRGMIAFGFKAGIGTASRRLPGQPWHVGALVLCNTGARDELLVAGVRLGSALSHVPDARRAPAPGPGDGSAILVLATDAPLQHPGLRRLCKRAALGLARCGAVAHHGSGDIAVAFSTADRTRPDANSRGAPELWGNALHDLFQAAVEATEEAVLNSLFGAEDTDGREGRLARALPLEPALAHLRAVRPDLLRAR